MAAATEAMAAARRRRPRGRRRWRARPSGCCGSSPRQSAPARGGRVARCGARGTRCGSGGAGSACWRPGGASGDRSGRGAGPGGPRAQETSRLASQIRRLYGANRRAEKPFWLCLTEFVVGSLIYEECFRMNDGFSNYLMDTTPESYLDLFPLDAIVYLTPDSQNVLEDIDPSKVYVLGGLVDESIHKKLTLHRAQEQSLQTARLPIREYMVKAVNTKNYHSETLAINQVFDVLSTYYETQSWPAALKAGVSTGKGYVLPDAVK
ncbi:tRNA methyltransferase 10 homolog B isoform X2 [Strix uralensis]|uniref:tRNA methyltransferase 10 homolog B isoform X2 n=1 Tax=Strix uralensis TaxID=36305 RepID=UPI003DA76FA6